MEAIWWQEGQRPLVSVARASHNHESFKEAFWLVSLMGGCGPSEVWVKAEAGRWKVDACSLLLVSRKTILRSAPTGLKHWRRLHEPLRVFSETLLCFKKPHSDYPVEASIIKIKHQIADLSCVITES